MSAPPPYSEAVPPQYQSPPPATDYEYASKAPQAGQAPAYNGGYQPQPYPQEGYPNQQQGYYSSSQPPQLSGLAPAPDASGGYPHRSQQPRGADHPPSMSPWRQIMITGFCDCCAESFGGGCGLCCMAWLCHGCLFGSNYAKSGQGHCCIGWLFHICLCGSSRSHIQRLLGSPDEGCCVGCMFHWFLCTRPCAIVQETRALTAWESYGKPSADAVPQGIAMSPV